MTRADRFVVAMLFGALLTPACLAQTEDTAQQREQDRFNCFLVVAGKECTTDGSVIVAHNEDSGNDRPVHFWKVEAAEHEKGERKLRRGGSVSFAPHTHGYIWCQMPGLEFSDTYFNEHGVCVISNGCTSREDRPDLTDGGIAFMLRRIVAARAKSAREGIEIATSLLGQFGYADTGRCLVVADAQEAWLLNMVRGKHWAAARVPDDQCAVVANHYTIHTVDPEDTDNFMLSPGLIDYAKSRGWYDPDRDGTFDFATVYGADSARQHKSNIRRAWRANNLLRQGASEEQWQQPTFVTPDKKLSITDLMAVLRDHCEDTPYDESESFTKHSPYETGEPTICAERTSFSTIFQLRSRYPASIGSIMWIAMCRPDSSFYVPWFAGINSIPRGLNGSDVAIATRDHFDDAFLEQPAPVTFNAIRAFETALESVYGEFLPVLQAEQEKFEAAQVTGIQQIEATAHVMHKRNPDTARAYLTAYSHGQQLRANRLLEQLAQTLTETTTPDRKGSR
ncbi:MAG: C69 family dipeptidase [Planctomycetota bacterium]|nr:C69 family dipeptidase [Planctomycetota bacterium]